jgi:hypothetical protein
VITQEGEEWEVDRILDKRVKYGKQQYLVQWKGFPVYDATWESATNVSNAPKIIAAYEEELLKEKSKDVPSDQEDGRIGPWSHSP